MRFSESEKIQFQKIIQLTFFSITFVIKKYKLSHKEKKMRIENNDFSLFLPEYKNDKF